MRQVFSSPRIENVDGVEEFLHQHGIATHVSNRDKLRRDRLRRPSYSRPASANTWPAVWVLNAEDLPRARQLLREAGLMGSTRPELASSYQLAPRSEPEALPTAARVRRVLLILLLLSTTYYLWTGPFGQRPTHKAAPLQNTVPAARPVRAPESVTPIEIIEPDPEPDASD